MTITANSNPATIGLDPAALQRLVVAIQADIDQGQTAAASIIVARGGEVGCRKVLGNIAPGRAAAFDDLYLLMSLSKSFAAALVLRAIDHGRFTLDTRAADILPGFGAGGKSSITVRQLLSHTAGTFAALPPRLRWGSTGWGTWPRSLRLCWPFRSRMCPASNAHTTRLRDMRCWRKCWW